MGWTASRINSNGNNFQCLGFEHSVTGELFGFGKNFTCHYNNGSFIFQDASGLSVNMVASEIDNIDGTAITTQTDSEIFDLFIALFP